MLWLRTSDTETDRTTPRQTCITSGINEPKSSRHTHCCLAVIHTRAGKNVCFFRKKVIGFLGLKVVKGFYRAMRRASVRGPLAARAWKIYNGVSCLYMGRSRILRRTVRRSTADCEECLGASQSVIVGN